MRARSTPARWSATNRSRSCGAHDVRRCGVEVVAGALNDEGSLAVAMRGMAGAFAYTTPFEAGVDAEVEQGRAIIAAPTPARMAAALTAAVGRPVRHERVRLDAIGNPDMQAMWRFLNGPGYQVDLGALHTAHPEVSWTSFADWAARTFEAGS